MWLLLLIVFLSFLLLVIVEESIEFFVNRYALGPAPWEGKVRAYYKKLLHWLKGKLNKEASPE